MAASHDSDLSALGLEVLVSTMDLAEDPSALADRLGVPRQLRVLVINQCEANPPEDITEGRVRLLSFRERGLSKSRNRALQAAREDFVLLADDDVQYTPGAFEVIAEALRARSDSDVLRFRHARQITEQPSSAIAVRKFSPFEALRVASVELVLKRTSALKFMFDERFGLGAPHPGGEEAVLVRDMETAGGRLCSCSEVILVHPDASSGYQNWTPNVARQKGATLARMYPIAWPLFLAAFTVMKSRHYREIGLLCWLTESARGVRELRAQPRG